MSNANNQSDIVVSVVIPAYNSARYIRQAIDSALRQNVPLEIIVIDDASTDHLKSVLAYYLKLEYFTFIRNPNNLGVAESRNIGVRAAKGRYIAFLDADDWWHPNKLKKQLTCIRKYSCVLCYTGRQLMNESGISLGKVIEVKNKVNYKQLLHHNSIACSSVLAERRIMLRYAMEHSEFHEDYLTWLRILKKYRTAYGVTEPLLFYRMSKHGKSRDRWHSMQMTYGVYQVLGIGKLRSLWLLSSHLGHGLVKYGK